jgi:hypothetical protein
MPGRVYKSIKWAEKIQINKNNSGVWKVLQWFLFIYYTSSTYTIQARGGLIITMKDNKIKTIEIVFLKNESRTMIIFVSDMFLKANHKTWSF